MSEGPVLSRQRFARTLAEQSPDTPGELPVADELTPDGYRRPSGIGNVRMRRRPAAPESVPALDDADVEKLREDRDAAIEQLLQEREDAREEEEKRSRAAGQRLIKISAPTEDRRLWKTTEFGMVVVSAVAVFVAERWGIDPDTLINAFYGIVALAIGRQGQKALRGMNER